MIHGGKNINKQLYCLPETLILQCLEVPIYYLLQSAIGMVNDSVPKFYGTLTIKPTDI